MRNRRLGHGKQLGYRAYAQLRLKKGEKYPHAGRVAEQLEKVGKVAQKLLGGQTAAHGVKYAVMVVVCF